MTRSRVLLVAACVVAAIGLASLAWNRLRPEQPRPNIVLIVIDALRPDRLGAYGYARPVSPNIDALARGGAVFDRAITQAGWTKPSIASLFTSMYPHVHQATKIQSSLPGEVLTLAEKLEAMRYYTVGIQTNPFLGAFHNFSQGFQDYTEITGAEGHSVVNELMGRLRRKKPERFFAYLHFLDVHLPYEAPPQYNARFVSPYKGVLDEVGIRSRRRLFQVLDTFNDADRRHISERYDANVNHVDDMVGRIFTRLKEQGYLENTLFIVTSDHGEELFDHAGFEHGHQLFQEIVRVPLIMHHPTLVRGGVHVKQLVRSIDVFPTIMGILGVEQPPALMGVDLMPAIDDPDEDWNLVGFTERVLYGPQQIAVQRGNFKMVQSFPATLPHETGYLKLSRRTDLMDGRVEFFDLSRDPREKMPFSAPTLERRFAQLLVEHSRLDPGVRYGAVEGVIDDQRMEQLKSLGYLGGK